MDIYFAQFLPLSEKAGSYKVVFPDLPGCETGAASLEEALDKAKECLGEHLRELGQQKPVPSGYVQARFKAESKCQELGIAIPVGTFYQAVQAGRASEKPVQIAVSMAPSLIKEIDAKARENGMTRSGLLALAAKKFIERL